MDTEANPSFHFDSYPDPTFHFDADPNPTFHFDAVKPPYPDPVHRQSDENLRPIVYRPSTAPF